MPPLAVVTGSSSGIGEAFAAALAARGDDLLLVARSGAWLEAVARRLRAEHGVAVEVFVGDLTDVSDVDRLAARMADGGRPPDVLVSNAGFGVAGPAVARETDLQLGQIDLHVVATTRLVLAVLPGMVARGSGGIVVVSSVGGLVPTPGFAVYGATKAYLVSLSESLFEELRGTGVRVTCVCPGPTRTGFGARAGATEPSLPKVAWTSPETVAEAGLAALAAGRAICIPGLVNRAMAVGARLLPRSALRRAAARSGGGL